MQLYAALPACRGGMHGGGGAARRSSPEPRRYLHQGRSASAGKSACGLGLIAAHCDVGPALAISSFRDELGRCLYMLVRAGVPSARLVEVRINDDPACVN